MLKTFFSFFSRKVVSGKGLKQKANSSRGTKFTNESCAARNTVEPACPSDTIRLVRSRVEMFCSPYCLVVSLYPEKTVNKKNQVDRSSREEVTHTHLNPEGLCAPRKAEKTALPKRKAARKLRGPEKSRENCTALTKSSSQAALPCPAEKQPKSCTARSKEHQRDAGLANQWGRQYWKENYRAIILRSQKIELPLAQWASEENKKKHQRCARTVEAFQRI